MFYLPQMVVKKMVKIKNIVIYLKKKKNHREKTIEKNAEKSNLLFSSTQEKLYLKIEQISSLK